MSTEPFELKTTFSPCGRYRYGLYRKLVPDAQSSEEGIPRKLLITCLLNPSIAGKEEMGEEISDPTATRCIGYGLRESCTGLYMINPMAKVVTDSKKLKDHPDREGPENFAHIRGVLGYLDTLRPEQYIFLCGWGSAQFTSIIGLRLILSEWARYGMKFYCLGRNGDGSPKHPLYLRADAPLQEYKP